MTDLQELDITDNIAMDIEQLSNNGFKPLKTFLNSKDLHSVLTKMRLTNGEIWPIPILFPKPKQIQIKKNSTLILNYKNIKFAKLIVSEVFSYDLKKILKLFFGTMNNNHPGVEHVKNNGDTFITGKLIKFVNLSNILKINSLNPEQTRRIIEKNNWKKIVGFHTRNPPHRAHEYLHKCSLENSDGLLIHPVLGTKKKGDFTNSAILAGYQSYIKNYLPKKNVILTPLLIYSRYAGPKEAVFTAIIRRNYGCTHFIVGRDHTGVKNFYGTYDSQKIFENFPDLNIAILKFDEPYFCKRCDQVTTKKTCRCTIPYHVKISGTEIRQAIEQKKSLSENIIRPEVLNELKRIKNSLI
tara:strand:- start:9679 stop:10740 length:1062 start_codon:yes stop_codon:yes gene_type:complete